MKKSRNIQEQLQYKGHGTFKEHWEEPQSQPSGLIQFVTEQ